MTFISNLQSSRQKSPLVTRWFSLRAAQVVFPKIPGPPVRLQRQLPQVIFWCEKTSVCSRHSNPKSSTPKLVFTLLLLMDVLFFHMSILKIFRIYGCVSFQPATWKPNCQLYVGFPSWMTINSHDAIWCHVKAKDSNLSPPKGHCDRGVGQAHTSLSWICFFSLKWS